MGAKNVMEPLASTKSKNISQILDQYGCGPIHLAGTDNGLYERRFLFDNVINLACADSRHPFEAFSRSLLDGPSQRCTPTQHTYHTDTPNPTHHPTTHIPHRL